MANDFCPGLQVNCPFANVSMAAGAGRGTCIIGTIDGVPTRKWALHVHTRASVPSCASVVLKPRSCFHRPPQTAPVQLQHRPWI